MGIDVAIIFKCKSIQEISEVYFSSFQNVSIGIVGKDMEFVIYDDDDVAPFLEGLEERPQRKVLQGLIKSSLDSCLV